MGFKNIVVDGNAELTYSNNYLIIHKEGVQFKEFLDNINSLMINSLQVRMTSYLINEISKRSIRLIFTNEKKNPVLQMLPFNNTVDSFGKVYSQLTWEQSRKDLLWEQVVRNKILNQAAMVYKIGGSFSLKKYLDKITPGDKNNAEGCAAKSYFKKLFGNNFSRYSNCLTNAALNYGYSILLSLANRIVVQFGFSTQFGIHHNSKTNNFNLSCDLIEPFRPFVDNIVFFSSSTSLDRELKRELIDISSSFVRIGRKDYRLDVAMESYFINLMKFLDFKTNKVLMVHELQ